MGQRFVITKTIWPLFLPELNHSGLTEDAFFEKNHIPVSTGDSESIKYYIMPFTFHYGVRFD